ncbi:putative internal virion protein [Caudoviricetes sp.]|nr:putative internal virion protein [Caudoviricetes sp.]
MSFAFPDIDPNTQGTVTEVPVPIGRYLDNMYEAGKHDTILESLNRITELSFADYDENSPILDPVTANQKWGVGNLKFEQPVRESAARIMNQRKRDEMDREFFLGNGGSAMRFVPGMAAAVLGSVSNPVDLGAMFIPFVGEEAAAAKATGVVGKALARRLVTRETLKEIFPRAPFLAESVINGMAGQALFEVPVVVSAMQDHADYTIADSAFNIGVGGAFSAAMHGVAKLFTKLDRGTKEQMAKQALNQFLKDENISVHEFASIDKNALAEAAKFDATAARAEAIQNIGGDMTSMESWARAQLEIDGKLGKINEENLVKVAQDVLSIWEQQGKDITVGSKLLQRVLAGDRDVVTLQNLASQLNLDFDPLEKSIPGIYRFGEATPDYKNQFARFKIEPITNAEKRAQASKIREEFQQKLSKLVDEEYNRQIEQFIAKKRAEHQHKMQTGFTADEYSLLEKRSVEGKTVTSDKITERSVPDKFDGKVESILDTDIKNLESDLKLDKDTSDAIRADFKKQSIDAAVNCIVKKVI